jgi:hypothetical protein
MDNANRTNGVTDVRAEALPYVCNMSARAVIVSQQQVSSAVHSDYDDRLPTVVCVNTASSHYLKPLAHIPDGADARDYNCLTTELANAISLAAFTVSDQLSRYSKTSYKQILRTEMSEQYLRAAAAAGSCVSKSTTVAHADKRRRTYRSRSSVRKAHAGPSRTLVGDENVLNSDAETHQRTSSIQHVRGLQRVV